MGSRSFDMNTFLAVGCKGYGNYTSTSSPPKWHSDRIWTSTPGYKTKRKVFAELPTNPYSQQIIDYQYGSTTFTLKHGAIPNNPTFYWGSGGIEVPSQYSLPMAEHSVLYNKCVAKFPTRINGTAFNLPLFIHDWNTTVDMITQLAKDIASKFKNAKTRRQMRNIWLEYRYGWRLLVMDINDMLCSLHDLRTRRPVLRIKAMSTSSYNGSYDRIYPYAFTQYLVPGIKCDMTVQYTQTFTTRVSVRFREANPVLGTLQQYGITNPIGLLWEVIPYSFVVDWLVPVSSYLQGMDTWIGKEFVSGSICYEYEQVNRCLSRNFRDPLNPAWVLQSGAVSAPNSCRRRFFNRVALTSFPNQSLPGVQLELNALRMADAVSLALQRIRH